MFFPYTSAYDAARTKLLDVDEMLVELQRVIDEEPGTVEELGALAIFIAEAQNAVRNLDRSLHRVVRALPPAIARSRDAALA